MTDKTIIKALECCLEPTKNCKCCPFYVGGCGDGFDKSKEGALYLIKRQQAEIERLKAERDEMHRDVIAAEHYAWKMRESKLAKDKNVPTKWISVTERLPEEDGIYLTCNKKKAYEFHFFQTGKRMWQTIWEKDGVTHWMPMPEPPKGD